MGPLNSNFFELVMEQAFAPQSWDCDYPDGRYSGECESKGGRSVTGDPSDMAWSERALRCALRQPGEVWVERALRLRSIWPGRRRNSGWCEYRGSKTVASGGTVAGDDEQNHNKYVALEGWPSG